MLRFRTALFVCLVFLFSSGRADASRTLTATLTNAAEFPTPTITTSTGAPRPASFGQASFVLNDAQTALTFTAMIFNIDVTGSQTPDANDNLLNAHIHASPTAAPGNTAPVVWGFFGSPFNDTTPNDAVFTPFSTGVGGTFSGKWDLPEGNNTNLAAQLANILSGHSYINFHTVQNTGGEIRGFLVLQASEPQSVSLLGVGLLALGFVCRRRFRR